MKYLKAKQLLDRCLVCLRKVDLGSGRACPECGRLFHHDCLGPEGICPGCRNRSEAISVNEDKTSNLWFEDHTLGCGCGPEDPEFCNLCQLKYCVHLHSLLSIGTKTLVRCYRCVESVQRVVMPEKPSPDSDGFRIGIGQLGCSAAMPGLAGAGCLLFLIGVGLLVSALFGGSYKSLAWGLLILGVFVWWLEITRSSTKWDKWQGELEQHLKANFERE
jgi:hypothetical protein